MGTSQDTQLSCQLQAVTTGTRFTGSGVGEAQGKGQQVTQE